MSLPGHGGRPLSGRRTLTAFVVAGLLLAAAPVHLGTAHAAASAASAGVRVSGSTFTRSGVPFVPLGLTLVGLLSPDLSNPVGARAAAHLGQAEMTAAKSWHVNTIRFQVSQRGLDPQDSLHTAAYDARIRAGVALARSNSFVVILSMQTQSISGGTGHVSPDAATVRAWQHLAPMFGTDPSVLFELFNEPPGLDDAVGWARWRDGGAGVVGHQHLVDVIRATGAVNVLIADGLRYAKSLRGVPLLSDRQGQVAYAFHPYLIAPIDVPSAWPAYFGNFAATHPVIATAWGAASQSNYCEPSWPTTSPTLISYLRTHRIGLAGLWAFDIPGTAVTGWTWAPNGFNGFRCTIAGDGPGQLVKSAFVSGW
jgi:Cellulase (glycosyl hydrolase family 5)